ncbi:bolA-like protein 2 isoform X2 [Thamnophis elegans]|uniref:bolA-like protein 2 isoform X2 n=1 Tax=Thamnophis elegans TaxID=35005 RepID=UPI001376852F|nr:bolA-like protein 2 isoform X2 [Thamnophis elegans]
MEPSRTLSAEALRERLLQGLEAEHVEVEDTTPGRCATSFKVLVVSPCFRGKALLQRHRVPMIKIGHFTTSGELQVLQHPVVT